MKTMVLINMLCVTVASYSQTAQRPLSASPVQMTKRVMTAPIYTQQSVVTLLNNTKDLLIFQLRYDSPGAQWATYQLAAGERKALSVKGTYLNLYMTNANKQPLTYSLVVGSAYQFYWSVPRGMYDVDLIQ